MTNKRIRARHIHAVAVVLSVSVLAGRSDAQALNMDGQSGVFFQPWADVVPSAAGHLGVQLSVSTSSTRDPSLEIT